MSWAAAEKYNRVVFRAPVFRIPVTLTTQTAAPFLKGPERYANLITNSQVQALWRL